MSCSEFSRLCEEVECLSSRVTYQLINMYPKLQPLKNDLDTLQDELVGIIRELPSEVSREQRRLKSNFGESDQLREESREAVVEVPFKDPPQRLARISRRHGRKEVDEDDSEDKDTVVEEDENEETVEEEIGFLVSGSQRGRKAWLNARRGRQ